MNIRIIAGTYGGRTMAAPAGRTTHPMGERIRNAVFNSLGGEISGASVLDVFAGSGVVGLEALSRGAKQAIFVERDRNAQRCILDNIKSLQIAGSTKLIKTTVSNWLESSEPEDFDIIFADPPYHDPQLSTVARLFGLLKPGGLMVLSHSGRGELPTKTGVVVVDNRSYGNAVITLYRRES
ncbi:MAG: 16S rRNA (guanine(966)-N(2))-methyltransferase RsmD [bacterium]|nr:16S rRNA (guanine(966)-N(2))-methyltransferase RsmD [bacterium]